VGCEHDQRSARAGCGGDGSGSSPLFPGPCSSRPSRSSSSSAMAPCPRAHQIAHHPACRRRSRPRRQACGLSRAPPGSTHRCANEELPALPLSRRSALNDAGTAERALDNPPFLSPQPHSAPQWLTSISEMNRDVDFRMRVLAARDGQKCAGHACHAGSAASLPQSPVSQPLQVDRTHHYTCALRAKYLLPTPNEASPRK
jgi:hypothetical protein